MYIFFYIPFFFFLTMRSTFFCHTQRVSHQNNGISWFWGNFWFRSNFFIFFSYWRWVPGTHLPKTEFLAVVSKMAKLPQNVIFDTWWILPIVGTVTSSFSMVNRLLANFPYSTEILILRWPLVRDSLSIVIYSTRYTLPGTAPSPGQIF